MGKIKTKKNDDPKEILSPEETVDVPFKDFKDIFDDKPFEEVNPAKEPSPSLIEDPVPVVRSIKPKSPKQPVTSKKPRASKLSFMKIPPGNKQKFF